MMTTRFLCNAAGASLNEPLHGGLAVVPEMCAEGKSRTSCPSRFPLLVMLRLRSSWPLGIIAPERRNLEGKFGKAYLAFKADVRRWI